MAMFLRISLAGTTITGEDGAAALFWMYLASDIIIGVFFVISLVAIATRRIDSRRRGEEK
jgi:hypothetical protein